MLHARVHGVLLIALTPLLVGLVLMVVQFCLMRLWPSLWTGLLRPDGPPVGQRTLFVASIAASVIIAIALTTIQHHRNPGSALYYMRYTLLSCVPTAYAYTAFGGWLFGKLDAREFGRRMGLMCAIIMGGGAANLLVRGLG